MATNPQHEGSERLGWPGKGKIMTEDAYHELERLSPDRKYEYIDGHGLYAVWWQCGSRPDQSQHRQCA